MAEIWAALRALPAAISLIKEIFEFAKKVFGDDPAKFIKDSAVVFAELKAAKTVTEKQSAAKKIQDLVARL